MLDVLGALTSLVGLWFTKQTISIWESGNEISFVGEIWSQGNLDSCGYGLSVLQGHLNYPVDILLLLFVDLCT